MPTLRHLLATQPYVFAPLCYNPLSARLAEEVGFQAVYLGGGGYGATLTWTEAMLTVTELADMTHRCATTVNIPVLEGWRRLAISSTPPLACQRTGSWNDVR